MKNLEPGTVLLLKAPSGNVVQVTLSDFGGQIASCMVWDRTPTAEEKQQATQIVQKTLENDYGYLFTSDAMRIEGGSVQERLQRMRQALGGGMG